MEFIYLACPYTHPEKDEMEYRMNMATALAAELMLDGKNVFSPLTHSHYLCEYMPEEYQTDFDFWISRDLEIVDKCDTMYVLKLDGWENSRGVAAEIDHAMKNSIPIKYVTINYLGTEEIGEQLYVIE
jgi:hypothetical protein